MYNDHSMYNLHELHRATVTPLRMMAQLGQQLNSNPMNPFAHSLFGRSIAAGCELIERATRRYEKPVFGLTHTKIKDKQYDVKELVVREKPFCRLLKFQRGDRKGDPKMLIVAPLSGHHSTLLRGTVEALLPHFEVYITDWTDAREVSVSHGHFDLDDYVDYLIEFITTLGSDIHTMAVCQPSVPLMGAISILSAVQPEAAPRSMTLIGGPIDTRVNPTEVNKVATHRSLNWFKRNVITRVPFNYNGFMRPVYPGFLQLTGFMTMNLDRHVGEHVKLFQHLIEGDGESAESHRKFYNEYLSVLDLPAEFYLQTIEVVFKEHALPRGTWVSRGRKIDPSRITRTALLTLEGELDDISGVGQTEAAQKLCSSLPKSMKKHHLQKAVGHYGIFNGRKFREHVVPIIVDFTDKHKQPVKH